MSPLAELFPDEDYRFHLTLRRGDLREFFRPTPAGPALLAERRRWIEQYPGRYAAVLPAGREPLEQWAATVRRWGYAAGADCETLGGELEPDFLLLRRDEGNKFRLQGGALVFPTSWALEEKLGRTMDEIHGVVPGLNPALGGSIAVFLARLKPDGPAFVRANWGLAATDALNLHPSQPRPQLDRRVRADQVWLRIEYQILAALGAAGALVFGIRIRLHPLAELLADARLRGGFNRALRTMPTAVVAYKGLAAAHEDLLRLSAPGAEPR